MTAAAGGRPEARSYAEDADEYRALVAAHRAARDEYLSGRHGPEAGRDWTPGSPHAEYHRTMVAKWDAGVQFHQRWGWWPEGDE